MVKYDIFKIVGCPNPILVQMKLATILLLLLFTYKSRWSFLFEVSGLINRKAASSFYLIYRLVITITTIKSKGPVLGNYHDTHVSPWLIIAISVNGYHDSNMPPWFLYTAPTMQWLPWHSLVTMNYIHHFSQWLPWQSHATMVSIHHVSQWLP